MVGRDLPEAHHIEDQRTGPQGTPFAQNLALGWDLIGNVCLGILHPPASVNVLMTTVHQSGRVSIFHKCEYNLSLKMDDDPIFRRQSNDNDLGHSIEDNKVIELMDKAFTKNSTVNWIAPLPFRETREILPNNRSIALKRALVLQGSLRRNTTKQELSCRAFLTLVMPRLCLLFNPDRSVGTCPYSGCTTLRRRTNYELNSNFPANTMAFP